MSDWIMLDEARKRASGAEYILEKLLSRNRVQVTAKPLNRPFNDPPDYVETLLAEADVVEIRDGNGSGRVGSAPATATLLPSARFACTGRSLPPSWKRQAMR
jgi:hypothetical protein